MLVGRGLETAHLAELLDRARHGSSASLVVSGEPGVGKSALLEELVASAGEVLVLRTQGLEAESPLAFAALHRLLLPVMRLREQLPAPQDRALRVAFGEQDGPSIEPFLVAVATLSMLTAAAEESTVLCVVEDAHWLDSATADALMFCVRRLGADRVLVVFSAREGEATPFRPDDIGEVRLAGLAPVAARELLGQRLGDVPAPEVTERLIAESGGNPLALLELPTELSPGQLGGSSPLPEQLHLTTRVEQAFLDRSRLLPPPVQSLLLVAAADDTGELAVVRPAASSLGVAEQALEAAVASGLLTAEAQKVKVRHPLVRSALYQAATREQRRTVHHALADALAGLGESDRETWHRAAATEGPDPEVVAALERVASRAERRGGYAAAMTAYERAAALSAEAPQRAALTFAAARTAWECGRAAASRALLSTARAATTDPVLLSDIARLRGHIEVNIGSATDAHQIFIDAAHAVHDTDPLRALEIAVAAAIMRTYAVDSGAALPSGDIFVEPSAGDTPRTSCLKQMLLAMTLTTEEDWSGAVAALDSALASGEEVDDIAVLGNLGNAALQLGDDAAQQFYTLALSRARDRGAVTSVVYALQRLCFGHLVAGDLAAVRNNAEEALALGQSIGERAMTAPPMAWLTLLAALQDRDDYDSRLRDLDEVVAAYPLGILTDPVHDLTRWAKGIRAASAGDNFGALHHLSRFRLPVLARMAAVERIDAAVRGGEPDLARLWIDELAGFAEATGRAWALAAVAYGRGMTTAEAGKAEGLFQDALSHYQRAGRRLDEARTHLAYGEWLRRTQRRVDARQHLRHALETFGDEHAETLVRRATQELRASGETARKRDVSTQVQLTPMELKVAQLVASGLSNKDVAAQIWVSPRTVAFHLRNVFAKAGVTSRGELAQLELT